MRRKVMLIGPATLVVSLPAKWARPLGIKKGDELEVNADGRELRISSGKAVGYETALLNVSDFNPIIMRAMGVLYKVGYKEIILRYDKSAKEYKGKKYKEIDLIKNAVSSYSGMDVKEIRRTNDNNYIVVVERAELLPGEFKNTMNQSFLHLAFISEEILDAMKNGDKSKMEEICLTEQLINQSTNFCQRVLNQKGYEDPRKSNFVYSLVEGIENLGDRYVELYKYYCASKDKAVTKRVLSLISGANDLLAKYYSVYKKFEVPDLVEASERYHDVLEELEGVTGDSKGNETRMLLEVNIIIHQLYDMLEPLMAIYSERLAEKVD